MVRGGVGGMLKAVKQPNPTDQTAAAAAAAAAVATH